MNKDKGLNYGDIVMLKDGKFGFADISVVGGDVDGVLFDGVSFANFESISHLIDWKQTEWLNIEKTKRKGKGINRIEDLKVGMTVYFKGGNGYVNEGEAASENNDDKVTGFIFDGVPCKIYLPLEDIAIEIDWEKTREVNKDKDMKFTSCQNVDCNKEYDFNDLIDAAVKAKKDFLIDVLTINAEAICFSLSGDLKTFLNSEVCKGINFFESLYTETFVIEKKEDILRIKKGAKITTIDGKESIISEDVKLHTHDFLGDLAIHVAFITGFGATVTQKISINE